jgi:2-oxo-4-hydroxy-4-carboxy--5-ureidoimidazoline (OHCU) decarboxylase
MTSNLPALEDVCQDENALGTALALLYEHSSVLQLYLVPQLAHQLTLKPADSYDHLLRLSQSTIAAWPDDLKAQFIAGHPRIGETKKLSDLSNKEQNSSQTDPAVLARLAHLNLCYEAAYPGLRYITFVNGRPREAILGEMETKLAVQPSLSSTDPFVASIVPLSRDDQTWKDELDRAVVDVGRIAQSRLISLQGTS